MNDLLLAIRSSYNNITSPTGSMGQDLSELSQEGGSGQDMSSFDNLQETSADPSSASTIEVDGKDIALEENEGDEEEEEEKEKEVQPPPSRSCESPDDSLPSSPEPYSPSLDRDSIFTPRSRKKWSQCTSNLYFSYRDEEAEEDEKETSIDGIFIKFDNNVPTRIVDKKRCSHISALARVTCVHHRPPKFVKRRAASLKSRSMEKMRDERCAANSSSKNRPCSAGNQKNRKPVKHSVSLDDPEAQGLDPLSLYLGERRHLPSRESLSESTESYHDVESEEREESDKENMPQLVQASPKQPQRAPRTRQYSVDEHFLEEGRFHLRESDTEMGTNLRPHTVSS